VFNNYFDNASRVALYGEVNYPTLMQPSGILNYTMLYPLNCTSQPIFYGGSTTNPGIALYTLLFLSLTGRIIITAHVVRIWEICNPAICNYNSDNCSENGTCMCNSYYTGTYCGMCLLRVVFTQLDTFTDTLTKSTHRVESISLLLVFAIVVPTTVIIIAAVVGCMYSYFSHKFNFSGNVIPVWILYRRRRNGLYKLIAEHQSASISLDEFELLGDVGGGVHRAKYKCIFVLFSFVLVVYLFFGGSYGCGS
jgi:hypothetical protein